VRLRVSLWGSKTTNNRAVPQEWEGIVMAIWEFCDSVVVGNAEAISGTSERNLREMAATTDTIRSFVDYKLGPVSHFRVFAGTAFIMMVWIRKPSRRGKEGGHAQQSWCSGCSSLCSKWTPCVHVRPVIMDVSLFEFTCVVTCSVMCTVVLITVAKCSFWKVWFMGLWQVGWGLLSEFICRPLLC
jgi:hypothetical protein